MSELLGKLWFFWGFVLVCNEQAEEGQWTCMRKKSLANAQETMLRYAQESTSSPIHVRIWMDLCQDSPGGSPCLVFPWIQAGSSAPCEHMAPPKCAPGKCITLPVIPVLQLPCKLPGLKCMQGMTALLQSRAGWGGWQYRSGLHWDHQEKKYLGLLLLFISCTCHDLLSGWSCPADKLHILN